MRHDHKSLFKTVIELAKKRNEKELFSLINDGYSVDFYRDAYTPLMSLAQEKDIGSVEFLINKFSLKRSGAILGYAAGGHDDQINDEILKAKDAGAKYDLFRDLAKGFGLGGQFELAERYKKDVKNSNILSNYVEGLASGNHVNEVNEIIHMEEHKNNVIWGSTITGYAVAGNHAQVDELLNRKNGLCSNYLALSGYAKGYHLNKVNQFVEDSESMLVHLFEGGNHLYPKSILKILSSLKNERLKEEIIKCIKLYTFTPQLKGPLNVKSILNEHQSTVSIMKYYQLDFEQAHALKDKDNLSWFLQGQALVMQGIVPKELFIHITSFVVGASTSTTLTFFEVANKKNFTNSAQSILNRFKGGFFSPTEYIQETQRAFDRYQTRLHAIGK